MDCNNNIQGTLLKGVFILILLVNCAGAATLNVPGNYTTIQDAIDTAAPGDTILVSNGTYYENVVVNKQLTLQGAGLPVVDASGSGSAITLSADGCTLQGFVASNSGSANSAITVSSSGDTISGNTVTGSNQRGIYLNSSSDNTVSGKQ